MDQQQGSITILSGLPSVFPRSCRISEQRFSKRQRKSEVTTLLWCDYSLLSEAERTFLETHPDKPETFSFRDLNQIPSYGKTALFGKTNDEIRLRAGKGPDAPSARIWQKVDLVRLLVLEHLFKTTGAKNVFYSDLDIINPQLTSSFAVQALKKHGMIVNMYDREGLAPKPFLENQFMAFSRSREKDVSEKLIPAVRKSYQDGHKNGWVAFCQYARKTVPDLSRVAFLARTLCLRASPSSILLSASTTSVFITCFPQKPSATRGRVLGETTSPQSSRFAAVGEGRSRPYVRAFQVAYEIAQGFCSSYAAPLSRFASRVCC
jgi:hypothetical protein